MKFYYVRLDETMYERPDLIIAEMESRNSIVMVVDRQVALAIVEEGITRRQFASLREQYTADRDLRSVCQSPRIRFVHEYDDGALDYRFPLSVRSVSALRRIYPIAFRDMLHNIGGARAYHYPGMHLPSVIDVARPNERVLALWRGVVIRVDTTEDSNHRYFIRNKRLLHNLGRSIRQSIIDRDSQDADQAMLDVANTALPAYIIGRCFDHYRDVMTDKVGEQYVIRADCGHYSHTDDAVTVRTSRNAFYNTSTWCDECATERTRVPADDDGMAWDEDLLYYHDDEGEWRTYPPDDASSSDFDDDDDDRSDTSSIRSYSANVLGVCRLVGNTTRFGDFTMGIELEMTSGREDRGRAANDVLNTLGTSYCIIKNDGSLPSNGFEVVTAPRMMAEHIAKFTAWTPNPAYRAWDVGSCGMHVHIDSHAFTALTLGKLLMFYNTDANAKLIRRIAGRHPSQDAQARDYAASESQAVMADPNKALKGKNPSRYRIINTTNLTEREADRLGVAPSMDGRYNTVEIRIFRASLKRERLLAQIEFANASVFFCRETSYRDLNEESFLKWLKVTSWRYPNLADWFGVRTKKEAKEIACADA